MNKKIIQIIITLILIGAVVFVVYDFYDKSSKQKEFQELIADEQLHDKDGNEVEYGADVGDMIYDYELTDIQSGETMKISDFQGKKVLMMFWASWCPHCKNQAPMLQELSEKRDDIVVIGVNLEDTEVNKEDPVAFVEELGLTYVNVYGPDEMHQTFQITSTPTSIFINSQGIIEEGVVGGLPIDAIESRFESID